MKHLLSFIATIFVSLLLSAQVPSFNWVKSIGGTSDDFAKGSAHDAAGNIYITGTFTSVIDFDPGFGTFVVTPTGGTDSYILKLDSAGNFKWAKSVGGVGAGVYGNSIVLDTSGNIFVSGQYNGTADFNPGSGTANLSSNGSSDVFILKLDTSGNYAWAKSIGGTDFDRAYSVATDAAGSVYATGAFRGTVDFNPGGGVFNLSTGGVNDDDIFILKLNASGSFGWAKQFSGGSLNDEGHSIYVDGSGNVYTAGNFNGTVDFDPGNGTYNLTAAGSNDVFISKLDASGNFILAKSVGGANADYCYSVKADAMGNMYVTGAVSIGSAYNIFVCKLDNAGNISWNSTFLSTTGFNFGLCLDLDQAGNTYITGYYSGATDFDPGAGTYNLTPAGQADVFICKLDATGNLVWAESLGGVDDDAAVSLFVNAIGDVYTIGYFSTTADFDPGAGTVNLTSAGNYDVFIHKMSQCAPVSVTINPVACFSYLSPDGNTTWSVSGTYLDTLVTAGGCDSVITVNLTVNTVDTSVAASNATFTANANGATYQWINCLSSQPVGGAANKVFTAAANGAYAVVVTQNGCTDTSGCYYVFNAGVDENEFQNSIRVFPSPSGGNFTIKFDSYLADVDLKITDVRGKLISEKFFNNLSALNWYVEGSSGFYFIELKTHDGRTARLKFVKE